MPELPEVETTAGDLRASLLGARIAGVHVYWPRTVAVPALEDFLRGLPGQGIVSVGRRGKYLLFGLSSGDVLMVHLRMTGQLRIEPPHSPALESPHLRARFDLADGRHLVFVDQRKFGRIWLVPDAATVLERLGPEPLAEQFTPEGFAASIRRRRAPIKTLLLDQTVLAGLGNIYANEALAEAGLHPLRSGASLGDDELGRLHEAVQEVLGEAIGARGTTLGDFTYRPPLGEQGDYQGRLRVHGRAGEPCQRCGTPIQQLRVGQRSAYFCPHCQPLLPGSGVAG